MIIIAKILCDCGEDITGRAVMLGGDVFCLACAEGVARNLIATPCDEKLRMDAIHVLQIAAVSQTPKEKRS